MDHMMPEMDGVEATHEIRRLYPEYADIPIIALSANAVSEARQMFFDEGLNDFVPKPMELKIMVATVRKWLPEEKIQMRRGEILDVKPQVVAKADLPQIGDLDIQAAFSRLGSEKLFWSVLKEYYRVIPKKSDSIETFWKQKEIKAYTVEVHALKSASRQIGAMQLADLAASMEAAGNEEDIAQIDANTPQLLEKYRSYQEVFAPWCEEKETVVDTGKKISQAELEQYFAELLAAAENLDMDTMEATLGNLAQYHFAPEEKKLLEQLKEAVADYDAEACEDIIGTWKSCRSNG
jgi:CheY-like chemotaxis protein